MLDEYNDLYLEESMDAVEAKSKGLPWTPYRDIPSLFRKLYDIELLVYPIAEAVVRGTDTYEMCCEYWFNNRILKAAGLIGKED